MIPYSLLPCAPFDALTYLQARCPPPPRR